MKIISLQINEDLISTGSTRINGNLECEGFKSSGSLKGSGNLIVHGNFRCSGSFKLAGSVTVNGNAKSTGSTTIDGEILIKGEFTKSGSLNAGKQVEALEGVKISGSTKIQGNLLSKRDVDICGSTTVEGNIKADNVFIGLLVELRPWQPYKVFGNIVADNEVNIKKTYVAGDVKGYDVKIDYGTEIKGEVYYINSIEVSPRATLANKPKRIK